MRWSFRQRNYAGLPIGLALALMFPLSQDAAQGREIDEYQSKAVCLYNFAKFVEWPRDTFKGPDDPIAVCILGDSPLGSALEPAVKGKPIGNRSLVYPAISRSGRRAAARFCLSVRRRRNGPVRFSPRARPKAC